MISRTILTLVVLLCSLVSVNAQDYIITKSGNQIQARVSELSSSEVKYKKWSNLNGPLYTIKIADIARINYENGSSDVFSDQQTVTRDELPATIFADQTGTASDVDLLNQYKLTHQIINPNLPKRLKLTAWIGGGALLATGLILWTIENFEFDYFDATGNTGIGFVGAGLLWFGGFYWAGVHKQKQLDKLNNLNFSNIYRHSIFENDKTSLYLGVDFIHNRTNTNTLGLGLSYNF